MKDIDRDFENCACYCDYCDYSETIESMDYSDINKELIEYGWVIRKIGNEWKEFCCRECYEKYMRERGSK